MPSPSRVYGCRNPFCVPLSLTVYTGKERLTRDTVRDATRQEINEIKRESTDLKHLVADLSLEVYRLKKTAIPPLEGYNGDGA